MANRDTHGSNEEEWVGFDLDGTLAKYDGWKGVEHIGKPVPAMVVLAYMLHKFGRKVKILTARVAPRDGDDGSKARKCVQEWCRDYLGFVPEVTHLKDASMVALFDDRACAVEQNTGKVLGGWPDFLPEPSKKAQKAILDKMPESEKKAGIELREGPYEDVKKVYDALTPEEKNFVTPGRTFYKDVPYTSRRVAYDEGVPVGFADLYGLYEDGSPRSSQNLTLAVSDAARGRRVAKSMVDEAIEAAVARARQKKNRRTEIKRIIWALLKENDASARAAANSGFTERMYDKPHSFRRFVKELSEKKAAAELVRVKKPLTIYDRLVRCVMRRNPGFSTEEAEKYISDGRLDAELAKMQ